jgi:MoxR-like ATPase
MLKVLVGYPTPDDEMTIAERALQGFAQARTVLDLDQLGLLQTATRQVYVDPVVTRYAVALANATRQPASVGVAQHAAHVAFGASPRGPINLLLAARALAVLRGRGYVLPQDVRELAPDVLRHRIVLSYQALAEEVTSDTILQAVVEAVPAPRIELRREVA